MKNTLCSCSTKKSLWRSTAAISYLCGKNEKKKVRWNGSCMFWSFWREKARNPVIKSCVFSLHRSHACMQTTLLPLLWIEDSCDPTNRLCMRLASIDLQPLKTHAANAIGQAIIYHPSRWMKTRLVVYFFIHSGTKFYFIFLKKG